MSWLTESMPVPPAELERLRDGLASRTGTEIDVAYRTVASPIGDLLLAATPAGLVRLAFVSPDCGADREDADVVLQQLADRISPRVLRAPGRLDETARQLEEYLLGTRRQFELALDFSLAAGFRREVLGHLRTIGYGDTQSYAEVASATGRPRAVRAVGTACATNPLPLVVPCHRVLRSDGSVGGYRGGPRVKARLLALESHG